MSQIAAISPAANISAGGAASTGRLNLEILSIENHGAGAADGAQFRAALERHMNAGAGGVQGATRPDNDGSLGQKMGARATNLATEINKDQQYVSKLLETATRTGDSMQLMKAMMALNDYSIRVQTVAKTVSKAASSVDQLTKLQ
ncbi:EscI/YscI/HrpB family type III secretion system inner rod protein [Noviherbaspirillum sp. Root189]|uniref:EscI/YscI/HrpB family type III secretion system inner rod protein n=1 Tax=Noviherbaspirillum sp. Root189 TaxID=1736487 RepID=UPI00070CDC5B|nr:EscI/YscI/HrpB family type III secretion system inner rod protein [Noviherbaspirillum sp. Root189]KRB72986.1 type III secretion protein [Noviherbaspirillum sp. Root189]